MYSNHDEKGGLQGGLLTAPIHASSISAGDGATRPTDADAVRMAQERGETVVLTGQFHPGYISYSKALAVVMLVITFWGIPFMVLLPCIFMGIRAKFQSFKIILTDKSVTFMQGQYACCCACWGESERIVPIEKITDCTWKQGWLQRQFDIDQLDIRTAAGNMNAGEAGGGADISLVGLCNAKEFRTALMKAKDQRDHFLATGVTVEGGGAAAAGGMAAPVAMNMHGAAPAAQYGTITSQAGTAALTSIDSTLSEIKAFLFAKGDCFGPSSSVAPASAGAVNLSVDVESQSS